MTVAPDKVQTPPFLSSLDDTAAVIDQLRVELLTVEAQKRDLDEKANDLYARIAAFGALRQAHGLPPV